MDSARVLWVAPPGRRPEELRSIQLVTASSQSAALEAVESLSADGDHLDAVVASPALPDGDGSAILRTVRKQWADAACFLHGDLWAIPEGSSLPVCEFYPAGQTASDVAAAVTEAVRGRYHRPYPVFETEQRRLEVLDAIDIKGVRSRLSELAAEADGKLSGDVAFVSIVEDYTVWVPAASDDIDRVIVPRGEAACTYAIEKPGTTTLEDLASDERLAHVEQFCTETARSYAGKSLWVDGAPVGVFAVVDDSPGVYEGAPEPLPRYANEAERILESAL